MKNWIKVGGHYINLDQIIEIQTEQHRHNYETSQTEPCVVFVRPISYAVDGFTGEEIRFFGRERENILAWLEYNPFAIHDIDDIPGKPVSTDADDSLAEHFDNRRRAQEQMDSLRRGMGLE